MQFDSKAAISMLGEDLPVLLGVRCEAACGCIIAHQPLGDGLFYWR